MKTKYGEQVGIIAYGSGLNVRAFAAKEKAKGRVVVFDHGHARVHKAK